MNSAPAAAPRTLLGTAGGVFDIVVVEPLARSTGHQSWFAGNLSAALTAAGLRPLLLTFDGLHDASLLCREKGCATQRVSRQTPSWLWWAFSKVTGVPLGGTAAPSRVRSRYRLYFYNVVATGVSVVFACRTADRDPAPVIHLLCPPSRLVIGCLVLARRPGTRVVITAFASPGRFYRRLARLQEMCRSRAVTIVVQTEALAADWAAAVGSDAVRMIPLPSEEKAATGDVRENRRLLDLPADKPIVAVIGCIGPQKGYIELFQALRGMPQDFRVLLIGDTGDWINPDPQEVVRTAGWTENTIIRRKFVPERLMPNLFGAVDVVALLYREPNASSGILSLCQQYGVPVLSTRFGEIGKKVESQNLGLTADPNRPEEVRHALGELLSAAGRDSTRHGAGDDPDSVRVKNSGTTLSWAEVAQAHLRLYAEIQAAPSD